MSKNITQIIRPQFHRPTAERLNAKWVSREVYEHPDGDPKNKRDGLLALLPTGRYVLVADVSQVVNVPQQWAKKMHDQERTAEGAALLDKAKDSLGWTWSQIAEYFGVSESLVFSWRSGTRTPEPQRLDQLKWLLASQAPVKGKVTKEQQRAIYGAVGIMIERALIDGRIVPALTDMDKSLDVMDIPGIAEAVQKVMTRVRKAIRDGQDGL